MSKEKKRLIIVDISSFIFRAFYAVRELHSPDGTPVNAVHGTLSMMLKLLSKYQPSHIFLARDSKGPNFRHLLYPEYKANRSAPPEELIPQFDLIEKLINKMELPSFALDQIEADDLIGAACVQWKDSFDEILIASGDKDLMQFIDGKIKMLDTMKDIQYGPDEVFEKMGVRPDQIVDYLSLLGDSSDNIPGMRGIGAKGAAKLLAEHGTLEACIEAKDSFKNKRVVNAFENHLDEALLSKELITIKTDIELNHSPDETKYRFNPTLELIDYLKSLGMRAHVNKVEDIRLQNHELENNEDLSLRFEELKSQGHSNETKIIQTKKELTELLKDLKKVDSIGCGTLYSNMDPIEKEMVGLCVYFNDVSYYLPLNHHGDLAGEHKNLKLGDLTPFFEEIFQNEKREVPLVFSKYEFSYFKNKDFEIKSHIFDITQAHFVLDPGSSHTIDRITERYLDFQMSMFDKKLEDFSEVSIPVAAQLVSERAMATLKLMEVFKKDLKENDLEKVYYHIDNPLQKILSWMETEGILLNIKFLKKFEEELNESLADIEKRIHDHIGLNLEDEKINLRSPKQLQVILFEKLELPVVKKTKTGYSTDSEVLETLDGKDLSPIPRLILDHREIEKLLGTYVRAFPLLLNQKTKKIHTHFLQHVAATGRLSSNKPNLQNIPIRSRLGKKMRKAFIAGPGKVLLTADYSQVELRILAHFSNDKTMVEAFKNDEDIHRQTAAEIMGISKSEVDSNQRSMAKAVNFGLMYGQSSFGLASSLKISRKEAKEYITRYFERFNQVKAFLDSLKEDCEKTGYAITLYGRKRNLPDINSQNRTVKSMAERVAVNSPIQGTAADIIKLAMIDIDKKLAKENLKSKMILQVHDELIFEVPEEEIKQMQKIVREGMENVVKLKVPLKVDMSYGVNWYDLK